MKKSWILFISAFILASLFMPSTALAKQGHMKLLAVTETSEGYDGGIADLYLEIKPGSGRVFLETFPLTKVDTQISTRFAKEIACDFADVDCNRYDFFYTITADSSIIGGPSAGAAISVLTFSLIKGVRLEEDTAITGTINSGGVIGPVGGLKAKIGAAQEDGIKKVLIPIGESIDEGNESLGNESMQVNKSINQTSSINETEEAFSINKVREEFGVEIKEVSTLDDALFEFTGKRFREKKYNLAISQNYADTMKDLAIELCSRSTRLQNGISNFSINDNSTKDQLNNALNLSNKGKELFNENKYYSSASYCFGSNVELNHLSLLKRNLTQEDLRKKIEEIRQDIASFDSKIERAELKTVTDLESYMVVKERLIEAKEYIDIFDESLKDNETVLRSLAYAIERANSAKSWAQFLNNEGKVFNLDKSRIKDACKKKLSEVEERLQYVQLYLPQSLENTKKELEYAYKDVNEGRYELCLFKASKAKANADTVLSVFGVKLSNVAHVVESKLEAVERNLIEETENGVFPIVGYSYFEYANSLKGTDPFSALLYSEYAMELSNLDIYFKSSSGRSISLFYYIDKKMAFVFLIGLILGISIAKIASFNKKKRNHKI